jgi:dATP pyrophosphohydrolase
MGRAPFQVLVFPFRRDKAGRLEYAIFRRTDTGAWQGIAGGGEDDETPKEAAIREAREEAGITARAVLQLAVVGAVAVELFRDRHLWDSALREIPEYAFGVAPESPALSLSLEHREFVWLPVEEALTRLEWESNRIALRELHLRLLAEQERAPNDHAG